MVVENNITKIVTLCHSIGPTTKYSHDSTDACQYFPNEHQDTKEIYLEKYKLVNDIPSKVESDFVITRKINVKRNTDDQIMHTL